MSSERRHPALVRLSDWLLNWRRWLFLVAVGVTLFAIPAANDLQLDESIESFYPAGDPDLVAWTRSKEAFGGDEFVMVAYAHPDLLSTEHLAALREFARQFRDPQLFSVPQTVDGVEVTPSIDFAATKDLGTVLAIDEAPMFRDLPRLVRHLVGRVLRQSLIDFSRNVLIGDREPPTSITLQRLQSRSAEDYGRLLADLEALRDGQNPSVWEIVREPSDGDAAPPTVTLEWIGTPTRERYAQELRAVNELLTDKFVDEWGIVTDLDAGQESQTTSVMLRLEPDQPAAERTATLRRIRELAAAHEPPAYVIGEAVQLNDMFRYVEDDSATLGWWTSGLLILVILMFFRSVRWVVLPLLVVHVTIIWTRAALAVSGMRLSMVSSMLNSLVTIIVIALVTHVTVTFRTLRADHDRVAAFRETLIKLAAPIFWACATTAIGFLVLLTSSIVPVRSFAIMMGIGTMMPLVAGSMLLPWGILAGGRDVDPGAARSEAHLVRGLVGVTRRIEQYPWPVLVGAVLVFATAAAGMTRLTVETDFSKNFRAGSPVRRSLDFFEAQLGGTGNWEVSFDAPEVPDEAFLERVRLLAADVRKIEMPDGTRLSKVYSLTDGLDFIPPNMGTSIAEKRAALAQLQPDYEAQLYNPQLKRMRLFLRAREQKPAEIKLGLIAEVERVARTRFPEARVTGLYVLIARMISSLLNDQLESFLLSLLGVGIAAWIAFRGFWIALVSLVPNVIPTLLVVGSLGWCGLPINLGTAMIACVSMGLTIDSSIHYVLDYRRARELGQDHAHAIRGTHAGVGLALVFANVALMAGFTVLCLSNFIPLIYFGVLVSLAMFGGLLGNLVLLPLLLRWAPLRF